MNIKAIPATYQDFIALADAYEREHFGFDEGGRAVAESTLRLLATFPPSDRLPSALVRRASFALMDDPLLDAFGFPRPTPLVRALVRAALAARGRVVGSCLRGPSRGTHDSSPTCAATPTVTTSPSSARFPPAVSAAPRAHLFPADQRKRGSESALTDSSL